MEKHLEIYAQVAAAVITQEVIDGNQNEYLSEVKHRHPDRFFANGSPTRSESSHAKEIALFKSGITL